MALPTQDVTWSTTGTKTDPGSAQKLAGWVYKQIVPYNWLNWLFGAYGDFINYFSTDISDGRDLAYGYKYATPYALSWKVSPAMGGFLDVGAWAGVPNPLTVNPTATPPNIQPTNFGGGVNAVARIPLREFITESGSALTASAITINSLSAMVFGASATSAITFRIVSINPSTASALATDWTQAVAGGDLTSVWNLVTYTGIAIDPLRTKEYALEILMYDSAAAANVKVGGVEINAETTKVQG